MPRFRIILQYGAMSGFILKHNIDTYIYIDE